MMNTYRRDFLKTMALGTAGIAFGFPVTHPALKGSPDAALLLSRLHLDAPGLDMVKAAAGDHQAVSQELLRYYRTHRSIKHFLDRSQKEDALHNLATPTDIETADNALDHLFVGQSAYPPFFAGDDIDWGLRPVPDNEWVWQFNRMSFWEAMGKAYWHTGKEKYAKGWAEQIMDWTSKNPNDPEHDYAWRSIEAGIRGARFTRLFQRFIDSPSFTPSVLVTFLNSCFDHADYLMGKYSKGSNWSLMEAQGMAFIAITFPEFRDARMWRDEAFRRLVSEIEIQVHPDGQQLELAMGYHLGSIGWFMRTYDLARMNGVDHSFPDTYIKSIENMCEVPLKLCHPDGTNPQFGDAWAGSPGQHNGRFRDWAERFNRDDFLYLASDGKEGREPDATAYALSDSGLYSLRSGWDKNAISLVLKCGPDGGWHCQPDNGTFELYAGGRNLMPDTGCYIYSGDPENRAWFRQTKVHQTITLNEENSAYDPRLLLWQPGENNDILVVENASYPGLTHRRAVFFVNKTYFILVDEAYGQAAGEVDLNFQFAPGKAVLDPVTLIARTNFNEGWNVLVQPLGQPGMILREEEGQVSFQYTKKEPRPAFSYRMHKAEGTAGLRYITIVAPYAETLPELAVNVSGQPAIGGLGLDLDITEQGQTRRIGYTLA
ncbi:MAG: alginate lyase family protein [Balneolales bacterium]